MNTNAGSSGPANQQSSSSSSTPIPPPLPTSRSNPMHSCTACGRSFTTKTGLGVHTRSAHPDLMDQMQARVDVKTRWCEEEMLIMAKKEAELTIPGDVRFMNKALSEIFQDRTLESIKKARQKTTYREAVLRFIDELEAGPSNSAPSAITASTPPASAPPLTQGASDVAVRDPAALSPSDDHFLDYVLRLPPPQGSTFQSAKLQDIIGRAHRSGKDATLLSLASYMTDIFPLKTKKPRSGKRTIPIAPKSRRKIRRHEYALTQRNFYKHQSRCVKEILEGRNMSSQPPKEVMEPFWRAVMSKECTLALPNEDLHQALDSVWAPITIEEIHSCKLPASTSPGPDGITSRLLRSVPNDILVRIFNLILWCGRLPQQFKESRTIFIPKKDNSNDPGDFRPITVPSVITRHLHSIFSKRLISTLVLDPRQQGFQPTDGCANNTMLVDLLLRDHHQRYASCHIASLDVSKAFDSVSHNAIFSTLESYKIPNGFVQYLRGFYRDSFTRLIGEGWASAALHPKCGVKQGDPLSPVLFNLIIDRLLKSLSKDIGCYIGNRKTNAMAFADDLILCASTPRGLQALIDHTYTFLASCGLTLNSAKCLTISIKGQPKQKNTIVEQRSFKAGSNTIPCLKRSDEWRYLGISFSSNGRCKYQPHIELLPKLDRLTKAPLKPQQRLHALRVFLIPQLYHKLVLGNIMVGSLNKTDRLIRSAVRAWLNLPKDTPVPFFHAPIDQGGLGIPSLRYQAPWLRLKRLRNLKLPNLVEVVTADTFIAAEMDKAEKRLRVNGELLASAARIAEFWSRKLYASIDGAGLREASHNKDSHRWIREPTRLLSGRDFVNCIKLRINALPSRSRTSRGRPTIDRTCRAGCSQPETTNHIVQQCHRTHSSRIDRHNSIVNYIERGLNNKGLMTIQEPTLPTSHGDRKPDLIIVEGNRAIVIDAQVVADGRSLGEAHQRKTAYYSTAEIRQIIQERFSVNDVIFCTATLNWRGIWSGASVNQLLDLKVIKKSETAIISTRVAIGSLHCFRIFNTTTSTVYRRGIG